MDDTADFRDDPCTAFFDARCAGPGDPRLRQAVLEQTVRVLRRRRRLRRLGQLAALAACYLAGLLTTRLGTPAPQPTGPIEIARGAAEIPERILPPAVSAPPDGDEPAIVLEQRGARAPRHERAALYRRAGDRYLDVESNPQAAVRCYTLALETASESELAVAAEDNWLLIAVKDSKLREIRHANRDG
jgi:hypothetical protein